MSATARAAAAAALALTLGACAVGPDFHRPAPPAATRYTPAPSPATGSDAQAYAPGLEVAARWWTLFGSAQLDALVEAALKANPDLQAAHAALRAAQENVRAQRGAYYPGVQAGASATRQRDATGTLSPTLASGADLYNLYTPQVSVSYVLDAFGANRRQVEALAATAEAQRFQYEATYVALVANVMVTAIQCAGLQAQVEATQELLRSNREQLAILEREQALGGASGAAVAAQAALLAQAEATLPALQKQLAQARDLLAVLTGRPPQDAPDLTVTLESLTLPAELPLTLPARLVEQRPDIRAAEAQLHVASAAVGVAIAAMLPQITISAQGGSAASEFASLFGEGTKFWSIGADLTQPLFAGGALVHHKRGAEATLEQAEATYRSTAQRNAEEAAARSLEIARRSVELGALSHFAMLGAEQAYLQARMARLEAQAGRYADTVALYQALGGGWWNRPAEVTRSP